MKHNILFWTPRILTILFALFISIFALDSKTAVEFMMHLMPTALILLALVLAWRHPVFGAAVFVCLGILYIVATWGRFVWSVYAAIAGPPLLVGALFLANWITDRRGAHLSASV